MSRRTQTHPGHSSEAAGGGAIREPPSLSLVWGFSVRALCLFAPLTEGLPAGRRQDTFQFQSEKASAEYQEEEKVGGQTPREKKTRHLGNKWIRISFIFESFGPSAVTGVKAKSFPGSAAGPGAAAC